MNSLIRVLVGLLWAGWGVVPAIAAARSAVDVLSVYAWCFAAALVAVAVLYISTLGFRR